MKTACPKFSDLKMQAVFTRLNKGLSRLYGRKFLQSYTTLQDGTVLVQTMGPLAHGKTSSLPNVIAVNSPRRDENRNHGKDESNQKPQ